MALAPAQTWLLAGGWAEGVGFEPTDSLLSSAFKALALGRYANPPEPASHESPPVQLRFSQHAELTPSQPHAEATSSQPTPSRSKAAPRRADPKPAPTATATGR
jgi:hypothetical protein